MYPLRVGLALVVSVFAFEVRAQEPATSPPADSAYHSGTLPNGLRYVVLSHASPKSDIGLRLMVQAGSLDEEDDQRGYAHFVEHMAFNGTRRLPPGTVRQLLENLGLRMGADINANTSYTFTNYLLDLPAGRSAEVEKTLAVLRDYADGLLFLPEQVTQESAVVLSELNARDSASHRISTQMVEALFAGTPLPNRQVSGVSETLRQATPDKLRSYYRRHYQPARMTVVMVGPIDPQTAIARITAEFGSLTPPVEKTEPALVPSPPAFAGVRPHVVHAASSKGAAIHLVHFTPRPPDTVEGRRLELVQRLATAALYSRMRTRRERGDITQFAPPQVRYEPMPFGALVQHSVELGCAASAWSDAIRTIESELRRAQTEGFSRSEIDEAAAGQLTHVRSRVSTFNSRAAEQIAAEISRQIMHGRTWQSPDDEFAETSQTLRTIEPAEVTAEIVRMFPNESLHLVHFAPPDHEVKPERLLATYHKSAGRKLRGKSADAEELVFKYEDFGQPGAIAKEERVADLDLTLITFANGAQLNLRPTTFEPDRFRLRVVFPYNYSDLPPDHGGVSELAGQIFLNSDLRKHTQTEISRLLKLRGVTPQFAVQNGTPVFTLTGPTDELAFGLQFFTALLSQLELDHDHYRVALSRYAGEHQRMTTTPASLALRAALMIHTSDDRRIVKNHPKFFANEAGRENAESWLRRYILEGSLEIGIVGDFDPANAKEIAAATIGTLKDRRTVKHGRPLSIPTKGKRAEGSAELPASTSMSCALWPVGLPNDPRSKAALSLATDILRDRAMLVLRETLGATYSPNTRVFRDPVQSDFAYVAMINTFEPAESQEHHVVGLAIAAHMAKKGVSLEEFNRLREPARSRHAQDMRNNEWWLGVTAIAQRQPEILDEMRRHETVLDEVTLADVNQAAAVFAPDRFTAVLLHPASANIPKVKRGEKPKPAKAG